MLLVEALHRQEVLEFAGALWGQNGRGGWTTVYASSYQYTGDIEICYCPFNSQDRGKIREMLDSVRGPLGSVYSLDGERQLIEAALLVRSLTSFLNHMFKVAF